MKLPDLKVVLLRQENGLLTVTLNRPEKKNALNEQLINDLKEAFDFANSNHKIKVVILDSGSDVFCSGADLASLHKMRNYTHEENLNDSMSLAELFLKIYMCTKPVIAAVNGPALAGGCGLATVCDFVIAGPDARFGYPEVKIGFIAALVSAFLIRQAGERRAKDLLLSGRIISAEEAYQYGIITKYFATEKRYREAIKQLTSDLLRNSSQAMTETKNIFNNHMYQQISDELNKLSSKNAEFRKTADFHEGLSAFLEKRKPSWITQKS